MKHSSPAPHATAQSDFDSWPTSPETASGNVQAAVTGSEGMSRRHFLAGAAGVALLSALPQRPGWAAEDQTTTVNLAKVASASSLYTSGDTKLSAMNDGLTPEASNDSRSGSWGTWPRLDPQWVEYEWTRPVTTNKVNLYWWIDGAGVGAPASYRILYWNGSEFVPVANPEGLGTEANQFNSTTFDAVTTSKLRLELISNGTLSPGILEWEVFSSGPVPVFPPAVNAGIDRAVVLDGRTYLAGKADWLMPGPGDRVRWNKESGPGHVTFSDETVTETTATFSEPGEYLLKLTAIGGGESASSTLVVQAEPGPPRERLNVVYTTRYAIDNPLWNERAKSLIVSWIPHCAAQCERTDLTQGQGGLDNFIEAAKALRGEPHGRHKGYVFSNAWVHQTVESMCIALMVDPQGDAEIISAQEQMKATLEKWIPIILAAQMPDGYLQTAYILADRSRWPERWSPEHRGNHEGYVSGYFIESAINHYTLTDGQDLRLYNAAKKLADCWVANIGPGKKEWFDGHQEMEQALVRFGRFVNDMEGHGRGDAYIQLAKFLLDCRHGGTEYDQSHLPAVRQYEAVGHAVRATYFYSGMADIAAETGDRDYQSAVISLWDNMVNRKFYLTGGIGSGETSEGFGLNYSLPNESYCESCSSCGLIFFQYKLNLAYHDARYADLYEQTMYNALLGAVDLEGKNFCYTNPLINTLRTPWHVCPCCVGNIPRTLLMVPTWSYTKGPEALHVNLFIGSRVNVGKIAGTNVQVVQKTDYPWSGSVTIIIQPDEPKTFSVHLRLPNRSTSKLYTETPAVSGLKRLEVNGYPVHAHVERGYVVIARRWQAGDRIDLELPMEPQQVVADPRVRADNNLLALRYGPLIYNVELADQLVLDQPLSNAPLKAEWRPDLFGGVVVITGVWQDGTPMLAVPNFARMNRIAQPGLRAAGDASVNYVPGTSNAAAGANPPGSTNPPASAGQRWPRRERRIESKVWMTSLV
jgi:uncharacterized protein